MINRETGVDILEARVRPMRATLLTKLIRLPDRNITEEDMPACLIFEEDDTPIKISNQSNIIQPCTRKLIVSFQFWDLSSGDVRNLFKTARPLIFANNGILAQGIFIKEEKIIGPFNQGIPLTLGIQLDVGLIYKDEVL